MNAAFCCERDEDRQSLSRVCVRHRTAFCVSRSDNYVIRDVICDSMTDSGRPISCVPRWWIVPRMTGWTDRETRQLLRADIWRRLSLADSVRCAGIRTSWKHSNDIERHGMTWMSNPIIHMSHILQNSLDLILPLYPLQDFKALYKYCIIIIIISCGYFTTERRTRNSPGDDSERELFYDDIVHADASAYAHWTDFLISTKHLR